MSPFAQAWPALVTRGLIPIPIAPESKAPSEFKSGYWRGMQLWQNFREKPPTELVLKLWSQWPACNIGALMGTPAGGGHWLACVDFDTDDATDLEALQEVLPVSPVRKKGRRGYSAFYRVPEGTTGFRTPMVELLTNTRQTVLPPSIHPDGMPYQWLTPLTLADVDPANLPVIDVDKFRETVEHLTKLDLTPKEPRAMTPLIVSDDAPWHRKLNNAAVHNLDAWVPELGLPKLQRTHTGYKGVAFWRPSTTGRSIRDRNANFSIISNGGGKDFGTGNSYTPINLVIAAKSLSQDDACQFLADRLGMTEKPLPVTVNDNKSLLPHDPETGEIVDVVQNASPEEFPDHLTRVPGLLGELVDWIERTAQKPNRPLALGAALTLLGTLMGRVIAGPTRSATHLYVVGIARSGAGKDHPQKCVSRLLEKANLDFEGPSDFQSFSSAINFVKRKVCATCMFDEIGATFKRMSDRKNTHAQGISKVLRQLWGTSFDNVMTPEWASVKSFAIQWPALSIFGASTEKEFFDALSGDDVVNGFLNRWLLISTGSRDQQEAAPVDAPEALALRLVQFHRWAHHMSEAEARLPVGQMRAVKQMAWNGGRPVWDRLLATAGSHKDTDRESFYVRTAEIAVRMATICAAGMDQMTIDRDVMQWAADVALWSARRMHELSEMHIAENEHQKMTNMVKRYIFGGGKSGLTHRELTRKLGGRLNVQQFKGICQQLTDGGEIVVVIKPPMGGGHPTMIYQRATTG